MQNQFTISVGLRMRMRLLISVAKTISVMSVHDCGSRSSVDVVPVDMPLLAILLGDIISTFFDSDDF